MPSLVEIGPMVLQKTIFLKLVNVFSLFRKYLPLEKGMVLHLNKFEFLSPSDPVVFEKKIFKHRQCIFNIFSLIRYYLTLGKGMAHHLIKFEFPSFKDALCQV